MEEKQQNEKTILLPSPDHDDKGQTVRAGRTHSGQKSVNRDDKVKPVRKLRLLLLVLLLLISSGTVLYLFYTYKEQKTLTAELKSALQNNGTEQAHRILKIMEQHRYTSEEIVAFSKQLSRQDRLKDLWNKTQQTFNLGMLAQAYNAVLPFTINTLYHDRAVAMIGQIQEQRVKGIIQTATTMYTSGNKKQAEQLLNYVLATDPGNKNALDILKMLRTDEATNLAPKHIHKKIQTQLTGDEAYKKGQLKSAMKLWSESHTTENQRKVVLAGTINKYLNLGTKACDKRDYASAASLLGKAEVFVNLLKNTGVSDPVMEQKIHVYLGQSYGMLGTRALSGRAYKYARQYFEKSLDYEPENQEALRGFSTLNDQADKLYKKAYTLSSANKSEACRLYKEAGMIARKDADVYKKIKKHSTACEQ